MPASLHHLRSSAFVRFAISGGGVAVVAVATYYLCAVSIGMAPLAANLVAYLIQLMLSYEAHRRFSFRQQRANRKSIAGYCILSLGALGLNSLWVWLLTDVAGQARWTPIMPMVAVTPLVTFAIARRWIFISARAPI